VARSRRTRRITSLAEGLAPFVDVIRAFITAAISAEEFEDRFYRIYESTEQPTDYEVTSAITTFYIEVDSMVTDPRLRRGDPDELSPDDLRGRAASLLEVAGVPLIPDPSEESP
jgi:hypothetical protein